MKLRNLFRHNYANSQASPQTKIKALPIISLSLLLLTGCSGNKGYISVTEVNKDKSLINNDSDVSIYCYVTGYIDNIDETTGSIILKDVTTSDTIKCGYNKDIKEFSKKYKEGYSLSFSAKITQDETDNSLCANICEIYDGKKVVYPIFGGL